MFNIKRKKAKKPIDQKPMDQNGLRHGEWLIYHYNGRLQYRSNWVHGVRHGLHEGYRSEGNVIYRGYWNTGISVGFWYYGFKRNEYHLCLL